MISSSELREKYIKFFVKHGHVQIPSAPLVPKEDPTTLFISAGMQPLVPYLLGQEHPLGKRLVNCQQCLRTGDIDEVGDATHLTFLEMLGNWSLGDYWKEEAISWSYEFLTKELAISAQELAVSVFAGDSDAPADEESIAVWKKLGIPESRIFSLGKKDNWWGPVGNTGPCGPDTEMFIWTGESKPEGSPETDKRWVEIWNNVFMEYNKTGEGRFEPLSQKNVDTGMGLERMLAFLQGRKSVFETELFANIYEAIESRAKTSEVRRIRVIADHIRASAFLIANGVAPSNVERGYVLRRLVRRAVRNGYASGIEGHFAADIAKVVVQDFSIVYSELGEHEKKIYQVLEEEEERFRKPLDGVEQYRRDLEAAKDQGLVKKIGNTPILKDSDVASGEYVFENYQSYGVPPDLAQDAALELGLEFDRNGFEEATRQHQEKSRTASSGKFKGGLVEQSEQTTKLHTVTHLLHQALRDILGKHVQQAGSNITPERLRFDFTHSTPLSTEEVEKVQNLVNKKIEEGLSVTHKTTTLDEATGEGALAFFGEKYSDRVKVYTIGEPPFSREVCGGPHVTNTSSIGHVRILKDESAGAGVKRIYAVIEN